MSGAATWDGYAARDDGKPLDPKMAALFPPGTSAAAPGHQEQPKRTVVEEPPSKTGKRRRKPVPGSSK
jgi:hypothetical protein